MNNKPEIIEGAIAIDDRGELQFVNNFSFENVKRFYTIYNHKQNFIRAWHGHKNEAKYCFVINGAAKIGLVKIDDWDNPSNNTEIFTYILSAKKPSILYMPPGYANGFMNLTKDTKIMFFSTSILEESKNDDIRFPYNQWDIWTNEYR